MKPQVFSVKTDHFQLLLGDGQKGPTVDTSSLWDSGGDVAVLPDARALVGIGTVRYGGSTRVQFEVLPGPSDGGGPGWTLKGTFELQVDSGEVVFWGPEQRDIDSATRVDVPNGHYSGLVMSSGTERVTDEEAVEGPDVYRVVMWRTPSAGGPRGF
jgi:hypothetical protein